MMKIDKNKIEEIVWRIAKVLAGLIFLFNAVIAWMWMLGFFKIQDNGSNLEKWSTPGILPFYVFTSFMMIIIGSILIYFGIFPIKNTTERKEHS